MKAFITYLLATAFTLNILLAPFYLAIISKLGLLPFELTSGIWVITTALNYIISFMIFNKLAS